MRTTINRYVGLPPAPWETTAIQTNFPIFRIRRPRPTTSS
jgi:hypothetical protein